MSITPSVSLLLTFGSTHTKPFPMTTAAPSSTQPCPLHPQSGSGPKTQRAKGKEQSPDVKYWKRIKPSSSEGGMPWPH